MAVTSKEKPKLSASERRANQQQKELEISERRRRVTAFYCAHLTQQEIAKQLSVSQATISGDIQAIRAEYRRERQEMIDREAVVYDRIERDLALLWDEKGTHEAPAPRNPDWLKLRLSVMKQRAELLGLNAPAKIAPTNPEGTEALPIFTEIIMVKPAAAAGDADD